MRGVFVMMFGKGMYTAGLLLERSYIFGGLCCEGIMMADEIVGLVVERVERMEDNLDKIADALNKSVV